FEINGPLELPALPPGEPHEPSAAIVLNLQGVLIPQPGRYTFSVLVDGRHLGDVSFSAMQMLPQAA
ncbi:MAG TPA: hypothetical protein VF705_10630, partial [Longimicrobium sp.]